MDEGIGTLLGGAIGGLGSLFGSIFGANKGEKAVEKQNAGNMALAQFAYEKDLEMWNRQNAYNSPYEQMQRLKQAGLNPHLMYGQGTTGNASSMPKYDMPQMQAYTSFGDFGASRAGEQLMAGLQGYANVKNTQANTDLIRQNIVNQKTNNELTELKLINQGIQNANDETTKKYLESMYLARLKNMDANTRNTEVNTSYTESQKEFFELKLPFELEKLEYQVKDLAYKVTKLNPAQLAQIFNNIEVSQAMKKVAEKRAILMDQEAWLTAPKIGHAVEYEEYERAVKEMNAIIAKRYKDTGFNENKSAVDNLERAILYMLLNVGSKGSQKLYDMFN